MILVLDNYDSFVHNIARQLRQLGADVEVIRSDALTAEEIVARAPEGVVISPGPRTPEEAGSSVAVIRALAATTPILGICLGHQAVGAAFGARIERAVVPMHGRSSPVLHEGAGILCGLPTPFSGGRYHSLVVAREALPAELEVVAWTEEGDIMAIRHTRFPTWGVQFHPESILAEGGDHIMSHFLDLCSGRGASSRPAGGRRLGSGSIAISDIRSPVSSG